MILVSFWRKEKEKIVCKEGSQISKCLESKLQDFGEEFLIGSIFLCCVIVMVGLLTKVYS